MPKEELGFEWDDAKAVSNLAKHRVSFETAAEIFTNEIIERVDNREDYGELRFVALGRFHQNVYRVTYTYRSDYLIRIVSAQKASRDESESTIVRHSLSQVKRMHERGEDMPVADAPEAESLGADFWASARVVVPGGKASVHLRLDKDVLEWFKSQGKGHLTHMNAVLRSYVEAQAQKTHR